MVKRKSKKVSRSVSRNSVKKEVPLFSIRRSHMTMAGWFFINLLIVSLFAYSLYLLWVRPWTQGVSLIVALLIIIFFMRLYQKLKRK